MLLNIPTDLVLIYGATSGVGSSAIQIARDIGCKIISTVGNDKKVEHSIIQINILYINES